MEKKKNIQPKLHIRRDDLVLVIAGDHKDKKGKVLSVDIEKKRAIIEGVNIIKKHVKPSAQNPQGGIIEKEAPIHISNLMLIDVKDNKAKRIGRKIDETTGKLKKYFKSHKLYGGKTVNN